ncbi:caspase activity and apoptosis inhibitor 1 [Paramormyrops kingsleyae]|uniref:Caspase activity and apoptosis inhibitor 1 n=1 Tax=Paramormyrops kingsleyae TaxID=1676925 RepID=A0A3B3RTT1_9TELE|nr:caspase activity and apoptosis inhibitor 1 [Paramormyrops kingsleyae]XP_023665114.1 caspase activity and apoptosis inhibitor 1 [Paramormyrops kingsleyae]XP_023665115.1 caspase activity and apoptosis inhibitor 1 [Paramormyrops kingsleyae]
MPGKKSAKEKKRKHSHSEGRHDGDRKRRSTESSMEPDCKEDNEQQGTEEPSDIEEGGLDLSVSFKPISAYLTDRQEMLEQCLRVLGENKLKKMLPDELKSCTFAEIKNLCWEQLKQLSQSNLLQILEGEEVSGSSDAEEDGTKKKKSETDSQQDNNVDSTSSLKENVEMEDLKQGGGSGEESDVLSINADTYDSDIEGPKEEVTERAVQAAAGPDQVKPAEVPKSVDSKRELQKDIEKSVSEILALGVIPGREQLADQQPPAEVATPAPPLPTVGVSSGVTPQVTPPPKAALPSAQQLELLELEMRARAIKALMKANEVKKQTCT